MKKDYIAEMKDKRKTTSGAMWILLIFVILFILIIIRFAIRSDSNGGFFGSLPSGNDAYEIAKDYIKPTLKSPDAKFANGDFQCTKTSDSVYVVKSYFETKNINGEKAKTNFAVALKYNGGTSSDERNWTLVRLDEN
jgi:hypothetical protein